MKLIFRGTKYDMFNPDECSTDEVEEVEKYVGRRWSECFDPDGVGSDVKLLKMQVWLSMSQEHGADTMDRLTDFKFKMGEVEYDLSDEPAAEPDDSPKDLGLNGDSTESAGGSAP